MASFYFATMLTRGRPLSNVTSLIALMFNTVVVSVLLSTLEFFLEFAVYFFRPLVKSRYSHAFLFNLSTLSIWRLNWITMLNMTQSHTRPLSSLLFQFFIKFFHKCIVQYLYVTSDMNSCIVDTR
jgi:hypothetical protein